MKTYPKRNQVLYGSFLKQKNGFCTNTNLAAVNIISLIFPTLQTFVTLHAINISQRLLISSPVIACPFKAVSRDFFRHMICMIGLVYHSLLPLLEVVHLVMEAQDRYEI